MPVVGFSLSPEAGAGDNRERQAPGPPTTESWDEYGWPMVPFAEPQVPHCRSIGLVIKIWQLPSVKVTVANSTLLAVAFTEMYL